MKQANSFWTLEKNVVIVGKMQLLQRVAAVIRAFHREDQPPIITENRVIPYGFDFSGASASKAEAKCTYTTFHSSHTKPSPEQPIMVLDNKERQWKHHSCGVFTNPVNRTAFDFKEEDGNHTADVVKIDSRFTSFEMAGRQQDQCTFVWY